MSGHGSAYCFKLAKLLDKKGKAYIPMIGGIHISDSEALRRYYQKAHHIIVHTQLQKNSLLQADIFKKADIRVMPLGVDTDVFKPVPKSNQNIELLFVGRITRLKQIELCLDTLAFLLANQNKKVFLNIIGPISDEGYYKELLELARQRNISEYLRFLGPLQQNDLVPHYQKAHLLLLPSAHESFGMVMVEAMACGTPVAALKGAGGPDEIIEHGVNGILTTKDNYAQKILDFVQSESLVVTLGKNALFAVEQKWSLAQTEDVLRNSIKAIFTD